MARLARSSAFLLLVLAACGDRGSPATDAAADALAPLDAPSPPTDALAPDGTTDSPLVTDDTVASDASDAPALEAGADAAPVDAAGTDAATPADFDGAVGFTPDFRSWLAAQHPTDAAGWTRAELPGGSFGGRASAGEARTHVPVVFIHGNSDRAVGGPLGGWTQCLHYYLDTRSYATGELFATTWGPADSAQASAQYHSRAYLTGLRGFVQAVLEYTGAPRVHLVSHSMGVTLARGLVRGGAQRDALAGGAYDLGPSLTGRVSGFVGIAGANRGLTACYFSGPGTPTCGATNGFYPGSLGPGGSVVGRSAYLDNLGVTHHYEGAFVASIWSEADTLIGYGDVVYGQPTSQLDGQDAEQHYGTDGPDHLALKETCAVQYAFLQRAEAL